MKIKKTLEQKIIELIQDIRDDSVNYFEYPLIVDAEKHPKGFFLTIKLPKELYYKEDQKEEIINAKKKLINSFWKLIRNKLDDFDIYRINDYGDHMDEDNFGYYYKFNIVEKNRSKPVKWYSQITPGYDIVNDIK